MRHLTLLLYFSASYLRSPLQVWLKPDLIFVEALGEWFQQGQQVQAQIRFQIPSTSQHARGKISLIASQLFVEKVFNDHELLTWEI